MNNKFALVKLPYSYDALEPSIDEKTMLVHYNIHYKGYLEKFNKLIDLYNIKGTAKDIMRNVNRYPIGVRDNGGGYVNHSLFWKMLKPYSGGLNLPFGVSKKLIIRDFGSYENFKKQILDNAKKDLVVVGFGGCFCLMVKLVLYKPHTKTIHICPNIIAYPF